LSKGDSKAAKRPIRVGTRRNDERIYTCFYFLSFIVLFSDLTYKIMRRS